MIARLLIAAVGVRLIAVANAQGLPATDNELYAGYCLGVSETWPALEEKLYGSLPLTPPPPLPGDTPARREWNRKLPQVNRQFQEWNRQNQESRLQFNQQLKQQQQRFASYLMSRGVLLPMERIDAFLGVLTARRQGQAEARECSGLIDDRSRGCLAVRESEDRHLDWLKDYDNAKKQEEKSWQDFQACLAHLPTSPVPVCERTARCWKPDNLPF